MPIENPLQGLFVCGFDSGSGAELSCALMVAMPSGLQLPPGSFGLPLIGEMAEYAADPSRFVLKRFERFGPIFKTNIMGGPTVFVAGADGLQFVLVTGAEHFEKSKGFPSGVRTLIGRSLVLVDGERHQAVRRALAPMFLREALLSYLQPIDEITVRFVRCWSAAGPMSWYDEIQQLILEQSCALLFPPEAITDELRRLFSVFLKALFGLSAFAPEWLPTPQLQRAIAARNSIVKGICRQIEKGQVGPALERILAAEPKDLTVEELAEQATFLLMAGYESTSAFMASLCTNLFRTPEVMARARAEQDALPVAGAMDAALLERMPYLDRVLMEIERIEPPFVGSFRFVKKPFNLQGYHVPYGWRLGISILGTHYDPQIFAEPERFDPGRFAAEATEKERKSLVGFGRGSRSCPGKGLALLQTRVFAARLLRDYDWELDSDEPLVFNGLVHRPKNGMRGTVRPRVRSKDTDA